MEQKTPNRNSWARKAVVLGLITVTVVGIRYFHLERYLTLDFIKDSQSRLQGLYATHTLLVIGAYMGIYILVTALSLPGAAVLTLAGGALLGLVTGTVAVSVASTVGATLACFVARFLLRDWVQTRFGERLATVNRGVEREGAFYLFTLRLIPVFPFFVINLVMGLTRMPLRTFFWVSQVGMLPGTLVYVNAGRELGKIDSLSGILSPSLIFSFVLLGLFPITVKKLMAYYRRKSGRQESSG
ncbi:MAG: TVP38/TMEM64 family protein [Thermodesulfobacteriota bacterium]